MLSEGLMEVKVDLFATLLFITDKYLKVAWYAFPLWGKK
jgi:hypothetical protein